MLKGCRKYFLNKLGWFLVMVMFAFILECLGRSVTAPV